MTPPERPRRSVLYLPASNPRAVAKARDLPADVIVLDLEDAVAPDAKPAGRAAALAAIAEGGFGGEVVVRVNALDTPWGADDLAALARSGADAVLTPKIAAPADIDRYDAALADAAPGLMLWTMIETCGAVLRLDAIGARAADTRLAAWIVGTNDLAKELRARPSPDRAALLPFLALSVAAARAHGIGIIDGVCNEFRDLAVLAAEAAQSRMLGFDGKSLIHPAQIGAANIAFAPSADELARARAVVAAFARPENAGRGVVQVDGAMAELLHLDEARRTLALADRIAAAARGAGPAAVRR